MNVFELAATLSLDTSQYDSNLKKSGAAGSNFASKIGGGLKTAAKVGTAAIGAITGAAVLFGKSIYKNANQVADYGDQVDKMSQRIGLSAEAYQKWDYVMKISGTEIANMRIGLKTLTNQLDKAKQGGKEAQKNFSRLGISMDDINKMSREEAFGTVIKSFQKMEDSTERAALANKMFGRSGQELTPLFNQSAKSTDELIKKAEDYGMVMSDKAVKASATFKDSLTTLSMTAKGLKNRLMGEFLPSLTIVTDGLAQLFTGDMAGSEKLSEGISGIISKVVDFIPKLLDIGSTVIGSIANSILKNAPTLLKSLAGLISKIIPQAIKLIVSYTPVILSSLIQLVADLGSQLGEMATTLIPEMVNAIFSIINSAFSNVDQLVQVALTLLNGIIDGVLNAIPILVEKLPEIYKKIYGALLEALPVLIDGIVQLVERIVTELPTIIKALISALPQIIQTVINTVFEALPQLIQGLVQLVILLVENLPTIILALIEAIPTIIEAIIDGFVNNIDKLVEGAIMLVIELVKHLPEIIWGLIKAIPKIVMSIVNAFLRLGGKFLEIGVNLVKGIWDGIVSMGQWLWDQISGFFGGIVDNIKNFFGIHSPSKLFRDQIGKNLALGIGEGFVDTMSGVAKDMEGAIPTDFDADMQSTLSSNIVPAKPQTNEQGNGTSFYFEINNPQIRNDEDIEKLAEKVSETLGRTFRQRSVAYG